MIKKITLINFRKHTYLPIDFDSGLNVITGNNDKGKSTVLKAVLYALFGPALAGLNKATLWNRGRAPDSNTGVQLELDMAGHGLIRVFRNDRVASVIREADNEMLATGQTGVTSFVENALGLSGRDLCMLLYSKQGETQELLNMGATKLQAKVEALAEFTSIDSLIQLISPEITRRQAKLEVLGEPEALPDMNALIEEEESALELQVTLEQKLQAITDEVKETHSLWEMAVKKEDHEAKICKAKKDLDEVNQRIAELSSHASSVVECQEHLQTWRVKVDSISTSIKRVIGLLNEKQKAMDAIIKLEALIANNQAVTAAIVDAERELALLTPARDQQAEAYHRANAVAHEKAKAATGLVCPTCKRPYEGITNPEALKNEARQAMSIAEHCRATYMEYQKNWQAKYEELESLKEQRRPEAAEHLQAAEVDFLSIEKELAGMSQSDVVEMQGQLDVAKRLGQLDVAKRFMREAEIALSDALKTEGQIIALQTSAEIMKAALNDLLSTLPEGPITLIGMSRSLKETYEKGVAMQNQIALDLRQAQQRSWEATAALRATEKKIAAEKSKAEQRATLSDDLKLHSQLKTYLTSARVRLSSSIWENLLGYASDKISEATEDDLTDLRRDLQGNLRVMQGGHDVLVEDLGGAKQSIVGLALRVALSQVFYGQGLPLLLDEVTSDCSDSTAAAMAGMLMGLGIQSICVSHRQGDASNADNIVEIL